MSRRLKLFTIAISTVAVLLLTIGGVVLADDSQPEGKHSGFRGEKMGGACHNGLLTEVLGLTPEEIRAQLQDGKTMPEIAADQGFSEGELRDAMHGAMTEQLQQKVEDGAITQEQADRILERIQQGAENGMPFGPRMGHPGCDPDNR